MAASKPPVAATKGGYLDAKLGLHLYGSKVAHTADAGRPCADIRCPYLATLKPPIEAAPDTRWQLRRETRRQQRRGGVLGVRR
jgi:hypothetical protein